MWSSFQRIQKIVLPGLAAMVLLFGVLIGISRTQPGILFRDVLLRQTISGEKTSYTGRVADESMTVTVEKQDGDSMVEVTIGNRFHDVCTVSADPTAKPTTHGDLPGTRITRNGETLFRGGVYDIENGIGFTPEGEPVTLNSFLFVTSPQADPWQNYETTAGAILRFAAGSPLVARGSWMLYLALLFGTAILAVDVARPRLFFDLNHRWWVKNADPTDTFLICQQVFWMLLPFALLIGYCIALRFIE